MAKEEGPVPEIVQSGEIPWSLEGLLEAMTEMNRLHVTPHDDWDRKPRGPVIEDESGEILRLVFNPDIMDNQIGLWLSRRLHQQGLDATTKFSHLWRFMEIKLFLGENVGRLREDGFVRDDPTDPERAEISPALLEVLATSRFDGVRPQGPNREPLRTFRYESVVEGARLKED